MTSYWRHKSVTRQRHKPMIAEADRFWQRINKTDSCWLYGENSTRYAQFILDDGSSIKAHRYSWVLGGGKLTDHDILLHSCDIRNCVNPSHLSLGTIRSNAQEMFSKGRNYGGYAQQAAKISKQDLKKILQALDAGIIAKIIAGKYGLTAKTVSTMRVTREMPCAVTKLIK